MNNPYALDRAIAAEVEKAVADLLSGRAARLARSRGLSWELGQDRLGRSARNPVPPGRRGGDAKPPAGPAEAGRRIRRGAAVMTRQQQIEQIAVIICQRESAALAYGDSIARAELQAINDGDGWTVEASAPDRGIVRYECVRLSAAELDTAIKLADRLADEEQQS